jgi:hypothetical protein
VHACQQIAGISVALICMMTTVPTDLHLAAPAGTDSQLAGLSEFSRKTAMAGRLRCVVFILLRVVWLYGQVNPQMNNDLQLL